MSFKNQFIALSFSVTQEGGAFAWSCYCICGPTVRAGTWQWETHLCGKRTQHGCLRPVSSTFSTNHCTLAGWSLGRSEAGKGGIERHARAFYSKSKWEGSESWKPGSHVIRSPLHLHPQFPSPPNISQDAIWLMDWRTTQRSLMYFGETPVVKNGTGASGICWRWHPRLVPYLAQTDEGKGLMLGQ